MRRRPLVALGIALAAVGALVQVCAGGAGVLQTDGKAPLRSTLTPGTAALLDALGGPAALSGSYVTSTTGGTTHVGYGRDRRSYHYHGQALDLRLERALWDALYGAMTRGDFGIVELYGPWGLYEAGRPVDAKAHARLWRGHRDHIHVSFTGSPEDVRAMFALARPAPADPVVRERPGAQARPSAAPRAVRPRSDGETQPVRRQPARLPAVRVHARATPTRTLAASLAPVAAAGTAGEAPAPGFLYGALGSALLALAVCALVGGGAAVALYGRKESWLKGRLAAHVAPPPFEQPRGERRPLLAPLFAATEQLVSRFDTYRRTARLLERSDLPLRPVEFLYVVAGAALVVGVVAGAATGPTGGLAGVVIGGLLPWLAAREKARRRTVAFENQLPDVLVTLAASLKSGHSFKQALDAVAEQGQPPISRELRRVLAEARLGRPLDEALDDMTARVGSKDLDFLLSAVTIQTQVGGSMAGLLELVSDTVRERQHFARKRRALTAQGRASAKVLIALPPFLALALTAINRDYMRPLFDTSTGHLLLALSAAMTVIGSLVVRRMVDSGS